MRSADTSFGRRGTISAVRWHYVASTLTAPIAQVYVDGVNLTNKQGLLALVAGSSR